MSSHHIVREKQEPALLILGLDSFSIEQLGQLLEWSPTVITTGPVADELISMEIKVDWVIGDNISRVAQSNIKFIPKGNEPVIIAALKFLAANSYPSVNIVSDNFAVADLLDYVQKINIVVFHQQQKIYAIQSGFTKWKPAGEKIELLTSARNLATKGLQNTAQNTFVTTHDGFFSLMFDSPFIFIAETL